MTQAPRTTLPEPCPGRRLIAVGGKDALSFLQGIVTNDLRPLDRAEGLIWCALLTPQGKYLADFFVGRGAEGLFLDLPETQADGILARLSLYRLRADVQFAPLAGPVGRGTGPAPRGALPDPRHPALGWRSYGLPTGPAITDWTALRLEHVIPEGGTELVSGDSYILEHGFERLHGVDFRKGCYVGQEVTARMKHKTDLRKGLVRVLVDGAPPPPGTAITDEAGREVGQLFTCAGGRGLAHLRLDRATGTLVAGAAQLALDGASA